MKKVICVFIFIISLLAFVMGYNNFDIEKSNTIANIENEIGNGFYIPDDSILSDPNDLYLVLEKVSKELKVNIFRQSITSDNNGDLELRKYALISSDTDFFKYFKFKESDNINENLNVNKFASTNSSNDENQIATIMDFGNNDSIYIGHLRNIYDISTVQGTYFVELSKGINFDTFIKQLTKEINYKLDTDFTSEYFLSNSNEYTEIRSINRDILLYSSILLLIATIFMSYVVLKNSKKINIYKLLGISNIRIWLKLFQINNTIIFSLTLFTLILISILFGLDIDFIKSIIKYQIIYYFTVTIMALIPYILIIKTNISLNLKNKTNEIFLVIFNNIFKVIFTSIILLSSIMIVNNYKFIDQNLNNLGNWEKSKSYGIFYPKYIGTDLSEKDYTKANVTMSNELYKILNKQGSIFIHSYEYEDDVDIINPEVFKSIKVNPNYLKEYPVYDSLSNTINISENEDDYILLVPETYKKEELKILEYFKQIRNSLFEYEKTKFSGNVRGQVETQDIRIIWTKKNQEIFSFNPEVNKESNNMIKDPIIEVATENNSVNSDLFGILGGGNKDPIKIKLVNKDPKFTYEKLKPYLIQLHLDDNLKYLVTSNEKELWNVYNMEEKLNILYITLSIGIACFLVIMLQNLIITFSKYKKKIIIRRLFGLSYIKSYKEHILIFFMNWIIQLALLMKYMSMELIVIMIIFSIIEVTCSVASIRRIEQKSKISVIKGE